MHSPWYSTCLHRRVLHAFRRSANYLWFDFWFCPRASDHIRKHPLSLEAFLTCHNHPGATILIVM